MKLGGYDMRIIGIAGWLLALGAAAGAGILYMERQSLDAELVTAREAIDTVSAEAAALKRQTEELEARLAALETAPKDELNPASLFGAMFNNLAGGAPSAPGTIGPGGAAGNDPAAAIMAQMGKIFESEATQGFMGSIMEAAIEDQYSDLFDELGLNDEQRAQMMDIYARQSQQAIGPMMSMFTGGEFDAEALGKNAENMQEATRAELAAILTPEQLAQVDAYEAELPFHSTRRMYEQQLYTSSLSPESRARTAEIIAEETVDAEPDYSIGMAGIMQQQSEGFDRALARLAEELSEEEYTEAERFIERQRRMTDMSNSMFESMLGEGNPFSALFGGGE
jgi:Spy/CpxP family protein refolding chaperone